MLFYLKEMIGEDTVNRAAPDGPELRVCSASLPVSWRLVEALGSQTPPDKQYLLKDLFEDITVFSNRTLDATALKRPDGKYDVTIQFESRKFKDDPKGNETEVPVDDWIDIGAFAKPEKGKQYGNTLYRDRVHVTQLRSTQTFTVDELPDQAGVDPFLLLVDRIPDDNVKKVTLASPSK